MFHDKTKHFEVDWQFLQQNVESGEISMDYIPTKICPVDMLMKALGRTIFETRKDRLLLKSPEEVHSFTN